MTVPVTLGLAVAEHLVRGAVIGGAAALGPVRVSGAARAVGRARCAVRLIEGPGAAWPSMGADPTITALLPFTFLTFRDRGTSTEDPISAEASARAVRRRRAARPDPASRAPLAARAEQGAA